MTHHQPVSLFEESVLASPYAAYEQLRSLGAIHYEPSLDLYFVIDYGAILEVLDNPSVYSSHLLAVPQRDATGSSVASSVVPDDLDVLAIADPPAHSAHRRLVQPTFANREVQRLRAVVAREAGARVDTLVTAGGGDWMTSVAQPVPVVIISQTLGLPATDAGRLLEWSDSSVELLSGVADAARLAIIAQAIAEFTVYLGDRLDQASEGLLVDVRGAVEHGQLRRDEAVNLLLQLVTAGTESTTSLLGSAVRILAADPRLQARLRGEPGLLGNFVEETLRLESPFRGHFRLATSETTLAGTPIPAGSRLMLLWGAANRDPKNYGDPTNLDLERPSSTGHLAFGRGIHFCIGAHLARLEARVALEHLLDSSDDFGLSADHQDVYRPSLLIRRLEHVELSITPRS